MAQITLQGSDLWPWQQHVFTEYLRDPAKEWVINVFRQAGKSILITNMILEASINHKNVDIGVVSLTYKQVKVIYSNVSEVLKKSGIVLTDNKSELLIQLVNGSKIRFLSAQNPDAIRGYTFDYLYCDEFAFYCEIYEKVLLPTTLAKGKKVVYTSTPRGTNLFFDKFNAGLDVNNPNIRSFKYDWTASPIFNRAEIENIRKQLPDAVFRAEFLAEFHDNGSVFTKVDSISVINDWQIPRLGYQCYAGIDVGLFHDYAVCSIMDTTGNILDMYRAKTGSISKLNQELEDFLKKWKPMRTLIELNNVGVSCFEHLEPLIRGVEGFKTTSVSKPSLINNLQRSIEEKLIKLPSRQLMPECHDELSNFSFTISDKTKAIIYGALPGKHDDIVVSLALVNELFLTHSHAPKKKMAFRM
jgi:hypothetical protein